ncbi:MAG: hypothetical protein IJO31_09745 [Oscillospiraceae bacterium]|nr:hypothetical protein [Oscillospiraceae bacterium]
MKKHNEGYTLVLVMVVLIVLCLLVSYVLTFSLNNLKTQQTAALRVQDQYAAAGEIEAAVVQLQAFIDKYPEEVILEVTQDSNAGTCTLTTQEASPYTVTFLGTADLKSGKLFLTVQSGTARIDCTLQLTAGAFHEDQEREGVVTITKLEGVEYLSYEMSTVKEGDGNA